MSETSWIWIAVAVAAFIAFNWWERRSAKNRPAPEPDYQLVRQWATARWLYLEILQRELANAILSENIEAFEKAFNAMRQWEADIRRADQSRRDAEYKLLLEKFPNLEDFDLIGTKHFILYNDRTLWNVDEAIERYKEISKFLLLDPERVAKPSYEGEAETFRERIQRYKNKRLKEAMEEAMARYYAWQQDRDNANDFKDKDYEVTSLLGVPGRPYTPEVEYGVTCKKLNEFGIYSFFTYDEGGTSESFHRSDPTFAKSEYMAV